uniref:Retrotransposon gag domain-containing protein n=1 Tax=Manihot esculenta TaxID=3983 RepID=A0A2C9W5N9_MANES
MKRAEKYIRQDDALVTSRFAKGVAGKEKAPEERRQEKHEKKHGKRDQRPLPPRASEQRLLPSWVPEKPTPLNASRAEVLVAVQDKEFLQWPKPLKSEADQRNPDKYCQFHRTHGHDTNNCFQLIAEIERLIKRGHLKNFVKKPEGQRPQPNPAVPTPRRAGANAVNDGSSGTINMIVGGTGGRMSRRGKKRNREGENSSVEVMQIVEHSSATITFSSEDAQGVQMPHDDALVIEAVIHNYWVKKILVDDRSKVNLLCNDLKIEPLPALGSRSA